MNKSLDHLRIIVNVHFLEHFVQSDMRDVVAVHVVDVDWDFSSVPVNVDVLTINWIFFKIVKEGRIISES